MPFEVTDTSDSENPVQIEVKNELTEVTISKTDIVIGEPVPGAVIEIYDEVGLPGEHVSIRQGLVYIDGRQLEEPYLDKGVMTREHSSG